MEQTQVLKICSKCGTEKMLEEFVRDPRRPSGYEGVCKLCRAEWYRQYSALHPVDHKKYRDPAKNREKQRAHHQKACGELTDSYVRKILQRNTGISASEMPDSLVRLRREQLMLKRAYASLRDEITNQLEK